jgi:hypothetical protein
MINSNIPVAAMALNLGQSLATTCALNRFFPKSTQKLCSGASFKQNQQLAASRSTVFPTESVQTHTETAQIHAESVLLIPSASVRNAGQGLLQSSR